MYRLEHATALARAIKDRSQVPGNIYVFGSARSTSVYGHDVDLLVEVSLELFCRFREECDTGGVGHIVRDVYDSSDYYWSYFSPREVRAEAALKVLGVSHADILKTDGMNIPKRALDIICLPVGWNTSPLMEVLQSEMSAHWKCDPKFMQNLRDSVVLIEQGGDTHGVR